MDFNSPRASSSLQAKAISFNRYKIESELKKSFSRVSWIRGYETTAKYPRFPIINYLIAESNPDFIRTNTVFGAQLAYFAQVDAYKNEIKYTATITYYLGLAPRSSNRTDITDRLKRVLENMYYDGILKSRYEPGCITSSYLGVKGNKEDDELFYLRASFYSIDDEVECVEKAIEELGVIFEKQYDLLMLVLQSYRKIDKTKLDWYRDYTKDYDPR